ncbi:hypothetical protein CDEST_03471 [Colletotrichum destructivum]|uniref:Rhodopsin domain-containing protein n=1 Tax=Colletotrichum destructivum TaxID=34406 RepID=A0AAX4I511_9PEZI|nr:hypothetical protein CDEST_03471 [Colletotrichum destructivum]
MSSPTGPIGAAPPPLGETPDFNNPRDAGHVLHLVYMCFIQTIVVVFFAIRVYVKLWANGKFRLEDWSCLVGWIFTVMLNTSVFLKLRFGEGFHIWEITASNFVEIQKWLYIGSLFYSPAAFFTKSAILLLTIRVFSVNKTVARTLHGLLLFFLLCYIPAEVAKAAVCIPVRAFWDPSTPNFKCINQSKLFTYDSSLSITSDLIILVVPVVLTWKLKVSTIKKIKIIGLLGAGGVAVAVTIYRLFLVIERLDDSKDPTVEFIPVDWTTTGELAIGIVCACVPSINYLHEQRTARRGSSTTSQERIPWWKAVSKRHVQSLSTWGMGCGSRLATGNRTRLRSVDSNAVLAATPESERGEPHRLDYDVELATLSVPYPEPHPGEPVPRERGGRSQSQLIPLPVIRRSSPFKVDELP